MIRYLKQEEKIKTRVMYEVNFPEDSKRFVDYYYAHKIKDNQILVMEENGELQVMMHLNPYTFQICKEPTEVNYVVAVATDASARRQGKMAQVMGHALRDMAQAHQPFTFLIPANPKVYLSSGFAFVPSEKYAEYEAQPELRAAQTAPEFNRRLKIRQAKQEDIPGIVSFANEFLEREYDIYPLGDAAYYERILAEVESEDGALMLLEQAESGEMNGIFSYGKEGRRAELQTILVQTQYRDDFPKLAETWFAAQGVFETAITDMDFMVRITDLKTFCRMLKSEEPFTLKVRVCDSIIADNNGSYEIRADKSGGSIKAIPAEETDSRMDIAQLTEHLFEKWNLFVREWV